MRSTKILFIFLTLLFVCGQFLIISNTETVLAQGLWELQEGKGEISEAFGHTSGQNPRDFRDTVVVAIKVFLSIFGLLFTILIIYGGFTWMTAGGSEERVGKAKKTITRAIIGMVIVIMSYFIVEFVITFVYQYK